jgi:hypothetical protein
MKTNETLQKLSENKKNKKNNGFRKDQGGTDIFPKSIGFDFNQQFFEMKAFILKKNKLFMQNYLNTEPFIIKKYIFTTNALC